MEDTVNRIIENTETDESIHDKLSKYENPTDGCFDEMFVKIELPNMGIYGAEIDVYHALDTMINSGKLDPMLLHVAIDNIVSSQDHTELATTWFCKEYTRLKASQIVDTLEQELEPQKGS
jgi:hypothetical protein